MKAQSRDNNIPLFTIITVVYNAKDDIAKTVQSVMDQDLTDFEYIIIDGNSSDGTVEFLNNNRSNFDKLVIEPDNGIYDAMNKGIKLSNGQFINFMNAGDIFFDSRTLSKVAEYASNGRYDVLYGDAIVNKAGDKKRWIAPKSLSKSAYGLEFSHQSVFLKKNLIENNLFDTSYKIAADYKQLITLINNNASYLNTGITITEVVADGVSDRYRLLSLDERYDIVKELGFCDFSFRFNHFLSKAYQFLIIPIKKLVR